MQLGNSFKEIVAAILNAELDLTFELNEKRGHVYKQYIEAFKELEQKEILTLPQIPSYATSNYHLFHILLKNNDMRNSLMNHLRYKGIGATFHYIPLHSAPQGLELAYKPSDLPITEEYSNKLLRLPLYPDLTKQEVEFVIEQVFKWSESI